MRSLRFISSMLAALSPKRMDALWQYFALFCDTLELQSTHFLAAYGEYRPLPFAPAALEPTPLPRMESKVLSAIFRFPSFELVTLNGSGVASLLSF